MNRPLPRSRLASASRSWLAPIGAVLALGATTAACSAIVSPDTSRLHPPDEEDSGFVRPDGGPPCPLGCDDGIPCTADSCGAVGCVHEADDDLCPTGQRCNAGTGCVPLLCTSDEDCDDRMPCNGEERCEPAASPDDSGCITGTPIVCNDSRSCTNDICLDATGTCVFMPRDSMCDDGSACTADVCSNGGSGPDGCQHTPMDAMCSDGVTCTEDRCTGAPGTGCEFAPDDASCDDGNPCGVESCDATAGCTSTPVDADGDGYPASSVVGPTGVRFTCAGGTDCDDTMRGVNPGAAEICGNRRDDNCSGVADEGCMPTVPDTCATAAPIALDAMGRGTVTGTFSTFRDDYAFCGSSGGRDGVYYFDVTSLSDVVIDTMGTGLDTVVAVSFDCSAPPTVCNDDWDPGSNTMSRLFLHRVGPASPGMALRVYVYVDAWNSSITGPFTLNVRVSAARADSCAVEPLDITGGGTVLGVGPFGATGLGQAGSCQGFGDRGDGEAVLRIRAPADLSHSSITAFSTTFVPEIYMRQSPCSTGTELACDIGSMTGGVSSASIGPISMLPATTFQFLFVDGMLGTTPTGGPHAYLVNYDP
jgi:hypothetical protein